MSVSERLEILKIASSPVNGPQTKEQVAERFEAYLKLVDPTYSKSPPPSVASGN